MGDLDTMCKKIRANGRIHPDMAVMGDTAMSNFIKNTAAIATADNRRFELLEVTTGNPVPAQFDRFVAGAEQHGIDQTKAAQIWGQISEFGAYSFNKAHSVGYSLLSYFCPVY